MSREGLLCLDGTLLPTESTKGDANMEFIIRFFDSRDIYKNLGVPWKRGVIFHGG